MKKLILFLFWGITCFTGCTEKTKTEEETKPEKTSGTVGTLTWTLSEDGTLTIEGEGEIPNYSGIREIYSPWVLNKSITHVVVLEGVTRIGSQAFSECSNLVSITIPKTVTSIGQSIAYNCCCLKKIVNYRETPQPVGGYIFPWVENESGCIVYVPAGSVEAYRAADGWKDFSNITMIE